jgi:hypothetical protein
MFCKKKIDLAIFQEDTIFPRTLSIRAFVPLKALGFVNSVVIVYEISTKTRAQMKVIIVLWYCTTVLRTECEISTRSHLIFTLF